MASKTAEKGERRRARSHAAATPAQNEAAVARPRPSTTAKSATTGSSRPRKTPKSCSCSRTCLNRVPSAIQSRKHQEKRLQKRFWKHRAEDSLEKKGTSPRFSSPEPPCTGPHPSLASSKAFVPVSTHWLQHSLKRIALEMNPLKKATCRQRSAPLSRFPSLQDISAFPHL